jgi:hypothetical protein
LTQKIVIKEIANKAQKMMKCGATLI